MNLMDQRIRELLDNLPPKSPRSKLEVHREVIGELRRRRRTYEEIAQFLGEHLDVSVAAG
jgi:hypothetical protein